MRGLLAGGRAALVLGALVSIAIIGFAAAAGAASQPPSSEFDVYDYQSGVGKSAEVELDMYYGYTYAIAPAKAVFYVPTGFSVNTSLAPGTQIGTIGGTYLDYRQPDTPIAATGQVVVDSPANYQTQTCAPGTHTAVWVMKTTVAGQEFDVPVYVDPATSDVSSKAAYTLTACFTAPSVPRGLRLNEMDVDLTSGLKNPSATANHVWRAVVSPFDSTGVTPALNGVELQAVVPLPQRLTLSARYIKKRHAVVLSGSVVAAGHGRAGVNVHLVSSTKRDFSTAKTFGVAHTNSKGHFTLTKRLTKTTYLAAYMNPYYLGSCAATVGPAPCDLATISPPPSAFARASVR